MESTVLIGCPACGRRYRYDAGRFGYTGIRIRCRTCESVMRVDVPPALQNQQSPTPAPVPESPSDSFPAAEAPAPVVETPPAVDVPEPDPVQDQAPAEMPVAAEAGNPRRALVADRDASLRSLLSRVLQEQGYQVTEAEDGPAVRREMGDGPPQMVVLNVFLPVILGVTLCAEIKRDAKFQDTAVILVGSLYRRDRFMRDPDDLYGADGFIDGSAAPDEIRKTLAGFCRQQPDSALRGPQDDAGEHGELARLARIVVGDIILYNPDSAPRELAAGNFLNAFAAEMKEGQALVKERFGHLPGHVELFIQVVNEAIAQHCEDAGVNAGLRA
jgi:CheY-like chemotaxis protein